MADVRPRVALLNLVCRGENVTLTSPSGEVVVNVCDGWCGMWNVEAHSYWAQGWRWRHGDMRPWVTEIVRRLKADLRFTAAEELDSVMREAL